MPAPRQLPRSHNDPLRHSPELTSINVTLARAAECSLAMRRALQQANRHDQPLEKNMRQSIWAALGAASLLVSATAFAQMPATPGTPQATAKSGVNVGTLICQVADGMGFVF